MVLYLIVCVLFFATKINGDTKVWTSTSDIFDKNNWQTVNEGENCKGLVFGKKNTQDIMIERPLNVRALTLPSDGGLRFDDNSRIVLDANSRDPLNCVVLKPIIKRSWLNYTEWKNLDNPDNPAIPYDERPPHRYDDIIFPYLPNTDFLLSDEIMQVKSITLKQDSKQVRITSNNQLAAQKALPGLIYIPKSFWYWAIRITNETCEDVTGCVAKLDQSNINKLCFDASETPDVLINCQDPIKPVGFCGLPQCGATIMIENIKPGFRLDKIKKKLREYKSYTHGSKISYKPIKIQIFFTEKDFTGDSVVEATEFYNLLLEDESYFCSNLTLQTSGSPLNEGSILFHSALSVIFGCFLAVIVIIALLFLTYSPFVSSLNIRNRLLGNRPLSTYILRYDNIEDRGYIVDGQSLAGSIIDFNRSFENPMYEQASSSRSTSQETIASVKLAKQPDSMNEGIEELDVEVEEAIELDASKEAEEVSEDILLKDI